mmetsp:Transcript_6844/g.17502  ORF Transcript_6844/g.17502 Transcript_6844/m.17502 type:complete len:576 (-) Transcript_6844:3847-5574(-)
MRWCTDGVTIEYDPVFLWEDVERAFVAVAEDKHAVSAFFSGPGSSLKRARETVVTKLRAEGVAVVVCPSVLVAEGGDATAVAETFVTRCGVLSLLSRHVSAALGKTGLELVERALASNKTTRLDALFNECDSAELRLELAAHVLSDLLEGVKMPAKHELSLKLWPPNAGVAPTTQGTRYQRLKLLALLDSFKVMCEREGGDMFRVLGDALHGDYRQQFGVLLCDTNTDDARIFRESVARVLNVQSFDERCEFCILLQDSVGVRRYADHFFLQSEGPCRQAVGWVARGLDGGGSTGFLVAPHELIKYRERVGDAMGNRLPKPYPHATRHEGGVGTCFLPTDNIKWRHAQPSYVAALADCDTVLYMINVDASKYLKREGMCCCSMSCPCLKGLAQSVHYVDPLSMSSHGDGAMELRAHLVHILQDIKRLELEGYTYPTATGTAHKRVKFIWVLNGKGEHANLGGMGSLGTYPCVRCVCANKHLADPFKVWSLSENVSLMMELASAENLRVCLQQTSNDGVYKRLSDCQMRRKPRWRKGLWATRGWTIRGFPFCLSRCWACISGFISFLLCGSFTRRF